MGEYTHKNGKIQVANLVLYGIALAVFGAIKAKECSDIVIQVTSKKLAVYRPKVYKHVSSY